MGKDQVQPGKEAGLLTRACRWVMRRDRRLRSAESAPPQACKFHFTLFDLGETELFDMFRASLYFFCELFLVFMGGVLLYKKSYMAWILSFFL